MVIAAPSAVLEVKRAKRKNWVSKYWLLVKRLAIYIRKRPELRMGGLIRRIRRHAASVYYTCKSASVEPGAGHEEEACRKTQHA